MNNKFIILVTNGVNNTIYVTDDLIDAEAFIEFFCEDVLYKEGEIKCQYNNYASGTLEGEEFTIEIFCPGEYKNVREMNYFKEGY